MKGEWNHHAGMIDTGREDEGGKKERRRVDEGLGTNG
jgi:hypothetical protein